MTHGPVSQETTDLLNRTAQLIDGLLNPGWNTGRERKIGFALLTYHFDGRIAGTGRVNYIGNGQRADVFVALKELVARWEGRHPEEAGTPIPKQ